MQKDVGIGYSGDVPNSLLARQDLEDDESSAPVEQMRSEKRDLTSEEKSEIKSSVDRAVNEYNSKSRNYKGPFLDD